MSSPTAHGLACASYGSVPSLRPVHADGEQLPHDVSMSARLFLRHPVGGGEAVDPAGPLAEAVAGRARVAEADDRVAVLARRSRSW